ncbi:MAG: polysaccharide biosynthesis tyrosine autokinase [Chitinophagaceae bacterium]|nr:MAG: polysaccharide biosynthesis tyrosine autokinase [Chitinophagaceae bacterium]
MSRGNSILSILQNFLGKDFNLSLLVSIIRKTFGWFLLILFITVLSVWLFLRYTQPIYETSSEIIQKTEKTAQILGTDELLRGDDDVSREIQIIRSRLLVARALEHLPLDVRYFKEGRTRVVHSELYRSSPFTITIDEIKDPAIYEREIYINIIDRNTFTLEYEINRNRIRETLSFDRFFENNYFILKASLTESAAEQIHSHVGEPYFFILENREQLISRVSRNIQVSAINPRTKTLQIKYSDNHPQKAKEIVETLTKEYINYDLERKQESASQILNFLNNQIDVFSDDLAQFQDTIKKFRIENRYLNPTDEVQMVMGRLNRVENMMLELSFNLQAIEWLENYISGQEDLSSIPKGINIANLEQYTHYLEAISDLEKEKNALLLNVKSNHPQVLLIEENIEMLKRELFENFFTGQGDMLEFQEAYFNKIYQQNISALLNIPEKEAEFSRLSRQYEIKERFFNVLLDKQAEYNIAKEGIVSDFVILRQPRVPSNPIFPNPLLLWSGGIILSLIAGIIIIVLRYLMHNTIISMDEIKRNSKVAILGAIPSHKKKMQTSEVVVDQNPKSLISEAFRSLRANLQFIENVEGPKTIAVTSTISGEGKTFIALNIAAIMCFLEKKVIVLDLDMRRPRLARAFNVANEKGMSTILIEKDNWKDCLNKSGTKNLDFLTSGPPPPNPSELILSKQFDSLIEELKKEYDYIVFDTPPVGIVTDALEVLKKANYPIYVVRADYSNKNFISNLDKLIDENHINKLSVVLNDVGRGVSGYYYGYGGYGYGYGYGYGAGGYGYGYYSDDLVQSVPWYRKIFTKKS